MNEENKFVIMVDDTKECCENRNCHKQIVQGHPIQQIYIDLSDCKRKDPRQDQCSKTDL
jgi:hypothetical protein